MTTATIFKSLADETRLSIVGKIVADGGDVPCKSILNDCSLALQLSQPTMSHHLARLVQAEVLLERKAGKEKYYSLNRQLLLSVGINPDKF